MSLGTSYQILPSLNLPARAFVAFDLKVEFPKRSVGHNQGVLPSAETDVMIWQKQQWTKDSSTEGA